MQGDQAVRMGDCSRSYGNKMLECNLCKGKYMPIYARVVAVEQHVLAACP